MKKILLLIGFIFINYQLSIINAQVPQNMNYQAVARNNAGAPLINSSIAVRISIRDSIAIGTVLYSERDTATTNAFGLFACKVGMGNVISGTFSAINWATNYKYMQVELDPNGGSSYTDMGTTQLLSVPYALHAKSAHIADSVLNFSSQWTAMGNNIYNTNSGNVGIGTSTPGTNLDVVGKVYFRTVPTDPSKQLVFDNNNGTQRIYTDASSGSPTDFILGTYPHGHTNQLVLQQSTGNVGIGTTTPAAKLDVEGSFKLADGTQGVGKVLTSDANGVASWTTLGATTNIGFSAKTAGVTSIPSSSLTQLSFTSVDFNDGGGFSTNHFTAPSAGVYHFDAQVEWNAFSSNNGWTELVVYLNGTQYIESDSKAVTTQTYTSNVVSTTIKLAAGDVVDVRAYQSSGVTVSLPAYNIDHRFSGYKVY